MVICCWRIDLWFKFYAALLFLVVSCCYECYVNSRTLLETVCVESNPIHIIVGSLADNVAADPIRLLVIPYESGWGSQKIPVNQFAAPVAPPPPPLLLPQQVERVESRGIDSGDSVSDMDSDWLMDG